MGVQCPPIGRRRGRLRGLGVAGPSEDWREWACAALRGYGVRVAGVYVKAPAGLMAGVALSYAVACGRGLWCPPLLLWAWPAIRAIASANVISSFLIVFLCVVVSVG